ncbi:nucleotidyltransferase family protein [Thermodesulfatator atlanticus]
MEKRAFVLAAGKGERLLPYTRYVPKPLFRILGRPLLELILDELRRTGFRTVGINAYHLAHKLKAFLSAYQDKHPELKIKLYEEKELLGPTGALYGARDFFASETLVINADIVTNFPYETLFSAHKRFGGEATLLLMRTPRAKNVLVSQERLIGFAPNEDAYTFCGLQVVTPAFVARIREGDRDLVPTYTRLLNEGVKINCQVVSGFYWQDIGTISAYLQVHEDLLKKRAVISGISPPASPFVFPEKELPKGVSFEDWVFLEKGVELKPETKLKRVVAWEGVSIPSGKHTDTLFIPEEVL